MIRYILYAVAAAACLASTLVLGAGLLIFATGNSDDDGSP